MSSNLTALLADSRVGTFTGLVTTKRGAERGPKGNKVRYGDDTVHVCIFTGFKYVGLCERSLDALAGVSDAEMLEDALEDGVAGWSGRGAKAVRVELTAADFTAARAELADSLRKSIAGTNSSTTDDVFKPLIKDGKPVRGARVYTGQTEAARKAGVKPAAKTGTIYLQGLKVSSRVIIPAPNGPLPASKSAPKSVAKSLLRNRLPISKYVSYRLEPGDDWILRAGAAAASAASAAGLGFAKVGELVARCG